MDAWTHAAWLHMHEHSTQWQSIRSGPIQDLPLPWRHSQSKWLQLCLPILMMSLKIGHITCDNAANNGMMIAEFARCYKSKTGQDFNVKKCHIRYVYGLRHRLLLTSVNTDVLHILSTLRHKHLSRREARRSTITLTILMSTHWTSVPWKGMSLASSVRFLWR